MKKLVLAIVLFLLISTMAACDMLGDKDPNDIIDQIPGDNNVVDRRKFEGCGDTGDYVVIDGVCIPMADMVSSNIQIQTDRSIVNYQNAVEMMDDFVADLSGSTGLAIVERGSLTQMDVNVESTLLSGEEDTETENIIVKLTEEGFFEEVSFTDDSGFSVEVKANPLALEVYGDFTVVIFEVNHGWEDPNRTFTDKVWDSFWSGGIYLIHNETGKLFATKDVMFEENSWTENYWEYRDVTISVTLNEPIVEMYEEPQFDEQGNPVLDEFGDQVMITVEKPILDKEGNPLIITEGPILTEMKEVPLVEYYEELVVTEEEVPVLDENGDPVLDENGNPIVDIIQTPVLDENGKEVYQMIEVPILDENGNQIIETMEVPVLDENGNPVMQETFDMQFHIEEEIIVEHQEYYATVTNSALTPLAERFVNKVMSEYYNWSYYRVHDYYLDDSGFTYSEDYIYYNDYVQNGDTQSRMVKRMYFDPETSEVVIEDYMDASKARFEDCSILVDPHNGMVVCNPWSSGNIKVYSETYGLTTIEDTENFESMVMPNGELFFVDNDMSYIEDLGYHSISLYTIHPDGTMNSSFIELGESYHVCQGDCQMWFNVNMMDDDGEVINERHMGFDFPSETKYYKEGDLYVTSIDEFTGELPACTDTNGCWYSYSVQIVDENGDVISSDMRGGTYYPGETPKLLKTYLQDNEATINYQQTPSQTPKVCESTSELGCVDEIALWDPNLNENGLWIWQNFEIAKDDQYIYRYNVAEDIDAVYEFTKTFTGEVCEESECTQWIPLKVYLDGELVTETGTSYSVSQGEIMPFYIELRESEDTEIIYETNTCNSAECGDDFEIVNYEYAYQVISNGDLHIQSITFADTDVTLVTEYTSERELCTEIDGCYYYDGGIEYIIEDSDGNPVITFSRSYARADYGHRAPYKVVVSAADCEIEYEFEQLNEDQVCQEETCYGLGYTVYTVDEYNNWEHIAWVTRNYVQGEKIIESVVLPESKLIAEETYSVCTNLNGCLISTQDYTVLLEDGTDVTRDEEYPNHIDVQFAYGEKIPQYNQFHVDLELRNLVEEKYRIDAWAIRDGLRNMVRLDENLYLVEKNAWMEGEFNYILTFDEVTNRYRVSYTNMTTVLEVTNFNNSFIAINEDETAIVQFTYDPNQSDENIYYFEEVTLTAGLDLNGVNDLIVDYDGSIYFKGVDKFLNDITGYIDEYGIINIDTEYTEPNVVRVRPIN